MSSTIVETSQANIVLVVDDDPVMRRMARYALIKDHLQVEEAEDGAQGLVAFQRVKPHLVLMDGMMPVLDGFSTCAELRRLPGGAVTPVLMVTALDDSESVQRAFDAGATDYVTKPVNWEVLRRRVGHLLQASMVEAIQARTEAVVRNAMDAIIACDQESTIVSVNPSTERILGFTASELLGRNLYDLLDDDPSAPRCVPGSSGEVNGRRKDGLMTPLEYSMSAFSMHGQSMQMIILHDASRRKRAESALRASEERYRSIITSMAEGVLVADQDGMIQSSNSAAERIFGLSAEAIRSRLLADVTGYAIHEDGTPYQPETNPATVTRETGLAQTQDVLGLRRPDGSLVWLMVSTQPLSQSEGAEPYGVVMSVLDITERQALMQKLRYSSTHDILTNLYNRAFFEEEMMRQEHGRRFPVSVVMADVDGMKAANDRLGHSAGDELLRHAAQVLRNGFRGEDVVARVGGDEFAVILPQADAEVAEKVMQRLTRAVGEWNEQNPTRTVQLSVGTATAKLGQSLIDAWKEADARMYQMKTSHKTR